jgi:hypothetical protein
LRAPLQSVCAVDVDCDIGVTHRVVAAGIPAPALMHDKVRSDGLHQSGTGRLVKTILILRYLEDKAFRRRIGA